MTPPASGPVRTVCIVMLSAIGDAVHVLPVANALKRAWPGVRISWIIQSTPKTLVEGHPAVDEFIVFERRRRGLRSWTNFADLAHYVRGQQFDLALALQVYFKAGVIVGMLPAKRKLGFDTARARDGNWLFTNERIPPHSPQHCSFVRTAPCPAPPRVERSPRFHGVRPGFRRPAQARIGARARACMRFR